MGRAVVGSGVLGAGLSATQVGWRCDLPTTVAAVSFVSRLTADLLRVGEPDQDIEANRADSAFSLWKVGVP